MGSRYPYANEQFLGEKAYPAMPDDTLPWAMQKMAEQNADAVWIMHRVSKNVPPLACYNFDAHEWILIFFW